MKVFVVTRAGCVTSSAWVFHTQTRAEKAVADYVVTLLGYKFGQTEEDRAAIVAAHARGDYELAVTRWNRVVGRAGDGFYGYPDAFEIAETVVDASIVSDRSSA